MSRFNYFPTTPYTNPAGCIEKQTNEIPAEIKAETVEKKKQTKKKAASKTVKSKKAKTSKK